MDVRAVASDELAAVVDLIVAQQGLPERHIGYLDLETDAVTAGLSGLEPAGLDGVFVAVSGGRVLGVLGTEWDTAPPRIWWHGPFAVPGDRWHEIADRLYATARALPPAGLDQQELAPDSRNDDVAAFADRHGFVRETGSAVLRRSLADGPAAPPGPGATVRRLTDADREAVAALHDRLFPATHTPGDRLDEGDDRRVLVADDGGLLAYVVVERQEGDDGYIDFLGVRPASRGSGVGARLVAAGCHVLRDEMGCRSVHLTVREDNHAARRLYERLGFVEERVLTPWRRGFSLRTGE